jgi:hypothetical protein
MTFDQPTARQGVMDAVSHGPQSLAQLAAHMLNVGVSLDAIYFAARVTTAQLIGERKIETFQFTNGDVVYRLPANTPMEPRKDK